MAFQTNKFNQFYQLLEGVTQNGHSEEWAVAENFILEERLTGQREDSYAIGSPGNVNEWVTGHERYLRDKINLEKGIPETFTRDNQPNILTGLEENQYLVRLEEIRRPCSLLGRDLNEAKQYLEDFLKNPEDQVKSDYLKKFLSDWNSKRDSRPVFVGFWGDVKDLFVENKDDWANRLRDRFGLGHLDPLDGEPISVVLLRYRLKDVLKENSSGEAVAVPTVLDGGWSPHFCPTPQGYVKGQTLDMSSGDEDDYSLNCEFIHQFITYKPEHLYRVGEITEPPGKSLEAARKIHMGLFINDFKISGK